MEIKGRYWIERTIDFFIEADSDEDAKEKTEMIFRPETGVGWKGQGWITKPRVRIRASYCPKVGRDENK